MRTQTRYGPKHDDLWPTEYRNTEPAGPLQFTRPTVLLANRISASAADGFVLAMRVLPHVTVLGDLTEGAFSAQFPDRLPNGWILWVAFKVVRDQNGACWDGVGVPPDPAPLQHRGRYCRGQGPGAGVRHAVPGKGQ